MTEMQPGQRFKLPDVERIRLEVEPPGDHAGDICTALICLSKGKIGEEPPVGVLCQSTPHLFDGALEAKPGPVMAYEVDLAKLKGQVERVVVTLWVAERARQRAGHLDEATPLTVCLRDEAGTALARFTINKGTLGREAAIFHSELYFKNGWRFMANGAGFLGGLPVMVNRVGLEPRHVHEMDRSQTTRTEQEDVKLGPVVLASDWAGGVAPAIPGGMLGAIARVIAETTDGEIATGTAFAITPGGLMLTCHHVIEDAARLVVVFEGKNEEPRLALPIVSDKDRDMALIRLADPWGTEQWLMLAPEEKAPDLGQEVGLLGYPLGQFGTEINYSQGIINSVRSHDSLRILQVDAGAAPGSSGGPLFRRSDGKVLGVLGGSVVGQNLGMNANLAIDVVELTRLGWLRDAVPEVGDE